MKLTQGLNLQLRQKLTLSQDMLLSLELIQLPLMELKERIEKEIMENPALELSEQKKNEDQDYDKIEGEFLKDESSSFLDSSSADINTGVSPTSSGLELKKDYLENIVSHKESLSDHLIWQLQMQNLSDEEKRIGMVIISLIDPDGFFKENLEEVFTKENELAAAKDVLEIIQLFDPSGVASKNVQEALLFQLESMKKEEINQTSYIILKDHFDLMVARKDNEIARRMKINNSEVSKAFEFIGGLNPYPGRLFTVSATKYVVPDAYVYKQDDSLVVEMNEDVLPELTINRYVEKIARETGRKKKLTQDERYIVDKIKNAKQFMSLLNYRNNSLFKLVLMLVKMQNDFFFKGPRALKPLTMKDVAAEIGLSESTISRLASSKYIETEWGIHEIKFFFSNSINKEGSQSETSSESVREMIKEIFENEKERRISDQKIVEILENKGVKIARRTVAKYRKMLNILPSHHRKQLK